MRLLTAREEAQLGRRRAGDSSPGAARSACRRRARAGRALALVVLSLPISALAPALAHATPSEGIHNIRHVVMIMQENRSFDEYFGTYPGANGIPAGVCVPDPVNGGCVKPFHDPRDENAGGPHGTTAFEADVDGGLMDGFVAQAEQAQKCRGVTDPQCKACKATPTEGTEKKPSCLDVMGYHDAREIPNYWSYAHNFVLQDAMFESSRSWSLTEHLYLVSGWSARCPLEDFNPIDCRNSLNPKSPSASWDGPIVPGKTVYAWTDITYLLDKAGVSWRYYVTEGNEPDCESDEALSCATVHQSATTPGIWNPLADFTDVQENNQTHDVQGLNKFYSAAHETKECGLPNVSWIVPNLVVSEHPPSLVSKGQAYVTTLINTIMRSPCWGSTAIFLSWDDPGGFYDHVDPTQVDQNGYGLRVPGLVVSPFAKTGYVDHQQLSHDAYLKFIEDDFLAGKRLDPKTDGRPDKRPIVREAASGLGDLANDFNFSQSPRPPVLLPTHPAPGPSLDPARWRAADRRDDARHLRHDLVGDAQRDRQPGRQSGQQLPLRIRDLDRVRAERAVHTLTGLEHERRRGFRSAVRPAVENDLPLPHLRRQRRRRLDWRRPDAADRLAPATSARVAHRDAALRQGLVPTPPSSAPQAPHAAPSSPCAHGRARRAGTRPTCPRPRP